MSNMDYLKWADNKFSNPDQTIHKGQAVNFELLSINDFRENFKDKSEAYIKACLDHINLHMPYRKSKNHPGYYFTSYQDIDLEAKEKLTIPTGLTVKIPQGVCLVIYPLNAYEHKTIPSIENGYEILESSYEGQIYISIVNHTNKSLAIKKNQVYAQGIFQFKKQFLNRKIFD